ncbi:MAG: hypothetical protein R2695_18325 [Acidimicrobiales bacterium]
MLDAYGVTGRVGWIELDLGALLSGPYGKRTYAPVSKYPRATSTWRSRSSTRSAALVEGALRKGGAPLLREVRLFDVYCGEGMAPGTRSLAYRLRRRPAIGR